MNIAVIFAGGVGSRMRSKERPKQFLSMHGKPIIIHTLELFENHPDIDAIVVSCVKDWISYFKELLVKYNIRKVKEVVEGGATGQDFHLQRSLRSGARCGWRRCHCPDS